MDRNDRRGAGPSPELALTPGTQTQRRSSWWPHDASPSRPRLDDDLFHQLLHHLGESGTAEFVILVGYYTMLAQLMDAFEVGVPIGEDPPTW